jgi:nucleotide-binding universal stress UspA family protein
MSGIQKILVPIDFSACSRQALGHAVELSERYFGASIDVLHVWEPPRFVGASTPVLDARQAPSTIEQVARVECLNEMERLLAEHEAKGIVDLRRLHESGETVPTILEVARRGKYDLMVLGTHGRTGMAHDYLGSVAEKIVRRAPCPVLTFREKHEGHAPSSAGKAEAATK